MMILPSPRWLFLLGILLGSFPRISIAFEAEDDASKITRVEQSLLGYHIIEGLPTYGLQERMAHYNVPGASVAVIQNFEIQWVANYGLKETASNRIVDDQTLFGMGSLSKAVTSACILSLVQEGKIQLDADVNPQLKRWKIPSNEFTAKAVVTPLLLMNHSAGLPHRAPFVATADKFATPLQLLRGESPSLLPALEVVQVPGTAFQYSNGGFTVLQILAEDAGGLPFDELVRQRVFTPLGMDRASFTVPLPGTLMADAARGHRRDGNLASQTPVWMPHSAAGGLYSTAEDHARFVVEIQKSIRGHSNRLFDQDLALQMVSPHASSQYGLGVFLYEGNGSEPYFSHIGDGAGFVGGFASHRTAGCGAVILTNGAGGINFCREVLRAVASVYDWPGYLPDVQRELPLSPAELSGLQGRYRLGLDRVVSLEEADGFLRIQGEGLPGYRLYRVSPDTFVCMERKGELAVGFDADRQSAWIDLHLSDDIGRLGEQVDRGVRMKEEDQTPLEQLLAGRQREATVAYRDFQNENPGHPSISESRFNRLGYQLLGRKDLEGALVVFQLNTQLYPTSANVYDSYGEALLAAGRKEEAAANYRRSLELNPDNVNAAGVLEELKRSN